MKWDCQSAGAGLRLELWCGDRAQSGRQPPNYLHKWIFFVIKIFILFCYNWNRINFDVLCCGVCIIYFARWYLGAHTTTGRAQGVWTKSAGLATKPNTHWLYHLGGTVNNACIERGIRLYKGFSGWNKNLPIREDDTGSTIHTDALQCEWQFVTIKNRLRKWAGCLIPSREMCPMERTKERTTPS